MTLPKTNPGSPELPPQTEAGSPTQPSALRIGFVPGIMPGKWFSRWRQRYGSLADTALGEGQGLAALEAGADMVLLRAEEEPQALDRDRYHGVELYREQKVILLPKDHLLTLLDEVTAHDLEEEDLLLNTPGSLPPWEPLLEATRTGSSRRPPAWQGTKLAVELVAAGVGLLVLPLSLARLYHRKDLTYRPVVGLEEDPVLLCWKKQERSPSQEALYQDFVGITRGRTAGSSRGSDSGQTLTQKQQRAQKAGSRGKTNRAATGSNKTGAGRRSGSRKRAGAKRRK